MARRSKADPCASPGSDPRGALFRRSTRPGFRGCDPRRRASDRRASFDIYETLSEVASMCTSVVEIVRADGAGKGEDGWFFLTSAVVSYDHPHHALLEEAITIDFMNEGLGPSARVAVEITLESAKELAGALARAIAGAEEMEAGRGQ